MESCQISPDRDRVLRGRQARAAVLACLLGLLLPASPDGLAAQTEAEVAGAVERVFTRDGSRERLAEWGDAAVPVLADLLAARTATEIRRYRAAGHNFAFLKSELAITPNQQFWAGEVCAAPAFTGPAASIDDLIARAQHPPVVGNYSGGNHFGNHGRVDSEGRPVMFLPPGNYAEYDLAPYTTPAERGQRRIVVGGGHRYYTADHYRTFKRFA